MNNDDISHFSTIPASFAIKSNVYFITHQYLIINNSQSQRALSVSVRTVLWIYFASRRNCGLLPGSYCPAHSNFFVVGGGGLAAHIANLIIDVTLAQRNETKNVVVN